MAGETPATRALRAAGIPFTLHRYDYDPAADGIGLAAAAALGEPPSHVLKTLMVLCDGRTACIVIPCDRTLAMKRVAAALSGKMAKMMAPPEAERCTGYRIGGISPLGQRRPADPVIEATAVDQPYVYVNAGQRGLQLRLLPADLVRATGATIAPVIAT